jgi:hypothetical protein
MSQVFSFKNGVYDLNNNIFREKSANDTIIMKYHFDYRDYSDYSDIQKDMKVENIEKIIPDQDTRDWFYAFAYNMCRNEKYKTI